MSGPAPLERVRPLIRTRQIREFTDEPPTDAELAALTEVARWSGSSKNGQPWRFIVIRDRDLLVRIHEAGLPSTRSLRTAHTAIAIVLPGDPRDVEHAFDEGRVAERLLVATTMLELAGAILWLRADVRPMLAEALGLPADHFVRAMVVVGTHRRPPNVPNRPRVRHACRRARQSSKSTGPGSECGREAPSWNAIDRRTGPSRPGRLDAYCRRCACSPTPRASSRSASR